MTTSTIVRENQKYTEEQKTLYREITGKIKEEQKALAAKIRSKKSTRKEVAYGFVPGLAALSEEYRHVHIAYSQLRGKQREEIERNTNNPPNEDWIQSIVNKVLEACNGR